MNTSTTETSCPGCGLAMPARASAHYDGYFHTTAECWDVFTEVMGKEFGDAVLFGQAHQLTVDSYAVQHAGGRHPDKSIDVHLCGLHLVLERGFVPASVAPQLQRFAERIETFPNFAPPAMIRGATIFEVALADSPEDHVAAVRRWAGIVWQAWSEHHDAIARLVAQTLKLDDVHD